MEIRDAFARSKGPRKGIWSINNLIWEKPEMGTMVLNVDGCVNWRSNRAGCAGVLKDNNGEWRGDFICSMQTSNVALTEGWAVQKGLEWAWAKGIRKLEVRTDT